jgi:hypothetical protein
MSMICPALATVSVLVVSVGESARRPPGGKQSVRDRRPDNRAINEETGQRDVGPARAGQATQTGFG